MKRLTFPKNLFVKHPEHDFYDDGTFFRCLFYKDKLPITATNSAEYGAFVDIRLDYLGMSYPMYREDNAILDEFNKGGEVDMDKFIANCEYILDKYIENPAKVEAATPKTTVDDIFQKISRAAKKHGFEAERRGNGIGIKESEQVRFYVTCHEDWDEWKTTRLVRRTVRVEIAEVKLPYDLRHLPKLWELEAYTERVSAAVAFVESLEHEDLSYEVVVEQ